MTEGINRSEHSAPPAPFTVFAPQELRSPLVFASPHSGSYYPPAMIEASRLSRHELRRAEDCFVDSLFSKIPSQGAPLIAANYARSWVDVSRAANELNPLSFTPKLRKGSLDISPKARSGLGVIPGVVGPGRAIYRNRLLATVIKPRLNHIYYPYHTALHQLLAEANETFGTAILIDCHSMPSANAPNPKDQKPAQPLADIVIGDCWGKSCDPAFSDLVEHLLRAEGFTTERNQPYAGGFCTRHYGQPRQGQQAIQLEVNRAIYMCERRLEPLPAFKGIQARLSSFTLNLRDALTIPKALAAE